jgi:hypothetical protein
MEWHQATETLEPYVVRITTPSGHGTGFFLTDTTLEGTCAIATAAHVIDHAHYWEQPIRIEHHQSGKSLLLRPQDRAIFVEANKDIAGILFNKADLPLPTVPLELPPEDRTLKTGNEVAWLGFPALPWPNLCFFGGKISSFVEAVDGYLVDGVAINGVSGGPTIIKLSDRITLVGVVSAYIANRATRETLPGVSLVRNIAPFRSYMQSFTSLDEAKNKESEQPPMAPPQGAQNSAARNS